MATIESTLTYEHPRSRIRARLSGVLRHVGLIAFGALMLYPLVWMITSSFKPTEEVFGDVSLIPSDFTLENYINGWDALGVSFSTFFFNSFFIAIASIILNLIACSMTAYAFARLRFPYKRLWFSIMLVSIMLPHHVVVVPQYILFNTFGWLNTFLPLLMPKMLATDAFFIFLMVQFIRSLPRELDDAAAIDGCGFWGTYWRIILPLSLPALATTAIFTFIFTWNDFFSQLIYLTRPDLYTVPLGLRSFVDTTGQTGWGPLLAMSVLSLVPLFIVFLLGQRYLVRGIATTGFK